MNKLEPNMYVRTLFGIKKIDHIDNKKTVWKYLYKINDDNEFYALSDNDVIKASYNIIDLIEEGDYVNGIMVNGKINDKVQVAYICHNEELNYHMFLTFDIEDIRTIVTKEQFSNMEYRLGE